MAALTLGNACSKLPQIHRCKSQAAEAAIEEGATRYLETDFLLDRGIETYGFLELGIGANALGSPWNGPITFNDRAWQGSMNQLYLINERILKDDGISSQPLVTPAMMDN